MKYPTGAPVSRWYKLKHKIIDQTGYKPSKLNLGTISVIGTVLMIMMAASAVILYPKVSLTQ